MCRAKHFIRGSTINLRCTECGLTLIKTEILRLRDIVYLLKSIEMQSTELQKNGRLLISRVGQMCYVRNKLLSKECELLSPQESAFSSPRKSSSPKKLSGANSLMIQQNSRSAEKDTGKFYFMSPPNENVREELKAAFEKPRLVQTAGAPERESPQRKRVETKVIYSITTRILDTKAAKKP